MTWTCFGLPESQQRFFWQKRKKCFCPLFIVGVLACVGVLASVYRLTSSDSPPNNPTPNNPTPITNLTPTNLPPNKPTPTNLLPISVCPNVTLTSRSDVATVTPWSAPIVWTDTFNPELCDAYYEPRNITVALTTFAVGKYTRFLKDFLETAERHFFLSFRVQYHVFTDQPDQLPSVEIAAGRELFVWPVESNKRWQDISAGRSKVIADFIETELRDSTDYIFCFDVDTKFYARWGTETLGALVAVIHPEYYLTTERSQFPYERRPASKAYMSADKGDFYYCGGSFGGEPASVRRMLLAVNGNWVLDTHQGVEAVWQDESHINRYLWLRKPSKVLSAEYQWIPRIWPTPKIKTIRFSGVVKDYADIRPGWSK